MISFIDILFIYFWQDPLIAIFTILCDNKQKDDVIKVRVLHYWQPHLVDTFLHERVVVPKMYFLNVFIKKNLKSVTEAYFYKPQKFNKNLKDNHPLECQVLSMNNLLLTWKCR